MKKILIIICMIIMICNLGIVVTATNYTMSWDFEVFNDPSARQVAINIAKIQDGLIEEEEDSIERFKDGLERRLFNSAQRNIVDMILNEDEIPYGNFEAGELKITVAEDPQTGEVLIDIVNIVTGESTTVTYSSDEWATGYDW